MLLPREKKILELLYGGKAELTTAELANALHISQRTIKADIKRVREELESTGCQLNTKTGRGIWLSYDERGKKYLDNLLLNGEIASSIIPETRKYYIAMQLLDADGFTSMESVAQSMFVSKGTVVNDINELALFFEDHGLALEKKVKYGIRVIGTEQQIRIAKASVIRKIVAYQGNQISCRLQPFFEEINLDLINEILQKAEEKFGFVLADTSYSDMMIHLSIIVRRSRKNKICDMAGEEIEEFKEKKEWPICEFMAELLEQGFDIRLSEGDKAYLMLNFLGAKIQNKIPVADGEGIQIGESSPQMVESWEKILKKAGEAFNENLIEDESLKYALFMHLKAMFNRLSHNIHLENPMKRMVKEELVYEFEVGAYVARLIWEEYNIELGEDEICDIALYLGAGLEQERAQKKVQPIVTIVCGSGMGTSQFFEARLRRMFPDIRVGKVLPLSRVEAETGPGMQDFVISTIPLELPGIDVITVTPMLNENDVKIIEKKLKSEVKQAASFKRSKYPNLFALLNDKISIFKCDCKSKEEVIRMLGSRLIHEKYVDEGFIDSVFKREHLAPTSIGDTFAIPHAFEGHVLKTGIGLMTLKKPIMWGNEKVQIVLMLSIDVRAWETFKSVFGELADITKDSAAIERFLNAEKLSEIKSL